MWSIADVRTTEPRNYSGDQKRKHPEGQIWIRYVSIGKRDGYIQKDGLEMEIRQIKYFLAISKFGSFTAAAKGIGVAQPALSTQMAKLEAELGGLLFVRHKRGVELTVMGERFKDHAVDIWERMEVARQAIRRPAPTGPRERPLRLSP